MFRYMLVVALCLFTWAAAQDAPQNAVVSGILENEAGIHPNTLVGMHVLDQNTSTLVEISVATPVASTFSLGTTDPDSALLKPWDSGGILLPGLQDDYTIAPSGVNFTRAITNVYIDNGNNSFDGNATDPLYLGVASLQNPLGFFILIYVDQPVTLTSPSATLNFVRGWNVFTVRFPEGGSPVYAVTRSVSDVSLDVFLPTTSSQ